MKHVLGKIALLAVLTSVVSLPASALKAPPPRPPLPRPPTPQLISPVSIFKHCGYSGYKINLGVGNYDLKMLQSMGMRDDDISSIRVSPGYLVTLYKHQYFQGRQLIRKRNDSCFVNDKFNDIVSSISVRRIPRRKIRKATVYQHCNFSGYSARLDPGQYTLQQLQRRGVKNNDLSSIKVPAGYKMILFENDNFSGRQTSLWSDASCLVDNRFNDKVSSIIFMKRQLPEN